MPNTKVSLQTGSKQTTIIIDPSPKPKESKGKETVPVLTKAKVTFEESKDLLEKVAVIQVDQKTLLPCLKSRVAVELMTHDKNIYKKANWKAMFQFGQDLERDVNNILEHPQIINKLGSESILMLMTTINKLGEDLMWVEDHRRNKFKDTFSTFMPGYEAEIKMYETSYSRLNTAVRALNPIYELKLETEKAEALKREQEAQAAAKSTIVIKADQISVKLGTTKTVSPKPALTDSVSSSLSDSSDYSDIDFSEAFGA